MSIIKIVDASTGVETERSMTAAEAKIAEAQDKAWEALQAELATKAVDKAALLNRLGITAEEAALLLG